MKKLHFKINESDISNKLHAQNNFSISYIPNTKLD